MSERSSASPGVAAFCPLFAGGPVSVVKMAKYWNGPETDTYHTGMKQKAIPF